MFKEDPKERKRQRDLMSQIHQANLRPAFMNLLRDGLSRETIESCIKEFLHEQGNTALRAPRRSE